MPNDSKNYISKSLEKNLLLSELPREQKALWKNLLLNSDIDQLQIIADALEEDKQNLQILTKNLKDKSKAVKSKNNLAWDEIIKNEEKILGNS